MVEGETYETVDTMRHLFPTQPPLALLSYLRAEHLPLLLAIPPIRVLKRPTTRPGLFYEKRLLFRNLEPIYSVYLLEWIPGAETPVHNHAFQNSSEEGTFCYFKVLQGALIEKSFPSATEIREKRYGVNEFGLITNPYYTHAIRNETKEMAYSLHIYPE